MSIKEEAIAWVRDYFGKEIKTEKALNSEIG